MAFCSNCGTEIPEGVKFCANCGASAGGVAPVNAVQGQVNTGNSVQDNTLVHDQSGAYVPRPGFEQAADQTRAFVVQPLPEPEPTGIDKFGKFFWIPLVILTIVDFVSDPPILTILLSAAIIVGAIFSLSRKYKLKGFSIICIILAAICLLAGISQAKKYGLFKISGRDDYAVSAIKDTADDSNSDKSADSGSLVNSTKPAGSSSTKPAEDESGISDSADKVQTGGVDPDLKAFLDSYEKFVDEYVDFMKKYMANPSDLSLLGEYTDMLAELSEFESKLDKYDSNNMSTEDAAYYLEVTSRCTQKMLEIL